MTFKKFVRSIILVLVSTLLTVPLGAQVEDYRQRFGVQPARPMPIATGNNLYCAGFIQSAPISTENRIVGAKDEADRFTYAQNDLLVINMGRNKGVNPGDIYSVVRPRGTVKSQWTNKSGLGSYVQEVGAVEVVDAKAEYSIARVKVSCDNFLLGDLIQLREQRSTADYVQRPQMNLFGDASGKASGRILMARNGAEMLAKDFVAYVDLGADDNVRAGDRLTIYRDLGKGNLMKHPDRESISSRDYGFQSEAYKGGKFSNQSARKSGEHAGGREVTTRMAKSGRPSGLRKNVGEAMVINVKEKTATILITRAAQEIHTGDRVELQ